MFARGVVCFRKPVLLAGLCLKSVVLVLTLGSTFAHAQTKYQLTELDGLGGTRTIASGINNSGDIVGWSRQTNGEYQAVRWSTSSSSAQVITGLFSIMQSQARDINDNGVIVGNYYDYNSTVDWSTGSQPWYESFVLDTSGNVRNESLYLTAINNKGETVGTDVGFSAGRLDADGNPTRVICGIDTNGQPVSSNCESAYANSINNNGDVVGDAALVPVANGYVESRAYLWEDSGNFQLLDDLYLGFSSPQDINDMGDIVGYSYDPSTSRTTATLWADGVPEDLGSLLVNSYAIEINNQGFIIGTSRTDSSDQTGTLWDDEGNIYDINDLLLGYSGGKHIVSLNDINDSGYILATLVDSNGVRSAALLSPVPVPAAAWLFASALMSIVGIKRRKK